jgi:hypothetical protein
VEVLDAALAVGMAGLVTGGTTLAVERDGALLGVAPADDPDPVVLVVGYLLENGVSRTTVGVARLLVPPARLAEFRTEEAVHLPPIDHTDGR